MSRYNQATSLGQQTYKLVEVGGGGVGKSAVTIQFIQEILLVGFPLGYYRPTWIEVNLSAIESNVKMIKNYIGENVHLMAVVKGNACGHGMIEVAEISVAAGATWIGVATLDEAIVVRSKLAIIPILVFGYVAPQHLAIVSKCKITVTAISLEWIKKAAKTVKQSFDFHLKLETGLNRLGCRSTEEIQSIIDIVSRSPYLNWTGVYTQFATAEDVEDKQYFHQQLERFNELLKIIPNHETKIIHCCNSCATLYSPEKPFFNLVRVGRGIMGPPIEKFKNHQPFPLQTSLSLHSRLVHVRQLGVGEKISYFSEYTTTEVQWIGTVPCGFADGWQTQFKAISVLVEGHPVAIVGRIAMDTFMVALPQKYPVGTRVTLIGDQADETIVGDDIENVTNQTRSQIFSSLSSRVPRLYIRNGAIERLTNPLLNQIKI